VKEAAEADHYGQRRPEPEPTGVMSAHRVHLEEAARGVYLVWAGVSRLSFQYSESWFGLATERERFTTDSAMTSNSQYVQEFWT